MGSKTTAFANVAEGRMKAYELKTQELQTKLIKFGKENNLEYRIELMPKRGVIKFRVGAHKEMGKAYTRFKEQFKHDVDTFYKPGRGDLYSYYVKINQ